METILCIPGPWQSRSELVVAVVEASAGAYIFAGQVLYHAPTGTGFALELEGPDEEMAAAFRHAGRPTGLGEAAVAAVAGHRHVAYLLGPTGSPAGALALAQAAAVLLHAGGLGVKVETAGKAFETAAWLRLLAHAARPVVLEELFVVEAIRAADATFFSCGLHNLGLKDALVRGVPAATATELLATFCRYQAAERPALAVGHTFSVAAAAPVYRLAEAAEQPYQGDDLFENPFGMWELVPA